MRKKPDNTRSTVLDGLWEELEGCEFLATSIADLFPALAKLLRGKHPTHADETAVSAL